VLAVLAGTMQMLSGGVEAILQTWLVIGALWALELARGQTPRARLAGRAAATVGWIAALAAVQLLPFLDLLAHSQRNAGIGNSRAANVYAMPWTGWANLLVPRFRCLPNLSGVLVQPDQMWTASYYLGAGAMALALLAAWRERRSRVRLLAVVAGLGLLLALGSRGLLYDAFRWLVPPARMVRYPVKFVMLFTFAGPLLAAYGLNRLERLPAGSREWRKVWGLGLGLAGLMGLIAALGWKYPLASGDGVATAANALTRVLFLGLILGCVALARRMADLRSQRFLQTALVLLLWFDVFTHTPNLSPTAPPALLEPDAVRQAFGWDGQLAAGAGRAMESKAAFWKMLSSGSTDLATDTRGRRLALSMNLNLLDHAAKFDGFYSLELKEYFDLLLFAYYSTNEARGLQDFVGASLVSSPTNAVEWVSRPSALPLITGGQQPVFTERAETINALIGDRFEPRRTVYLPPEARSQIQLEPRPDVKISFSRFSSSRLDFEVEASGRALVVVAQAYYHCWHAYLDGRPTPLWRANHAFQALEVPAGRHRVSVVYEDRAFFWGALLTLGAALACGAAWLAWRRADAGLTRVALNNWDASNLSRP
jgi:hypothetical protein